ncbi:MAG TPA: hypothetical protein VGV61_06070, partial [Thermoanaerobaculia bacterium]|nr:hypothetical protein [Thermoanaerobaculia bacterium]
MPSRAAAASGLASGVVGTLAASLALLALAGAALGAGACAGTRRPQAPSAGPPPRPAANPAGLTHLEERALLLLLVDRQIFEPYTVEQSLLGDAALRERLAFALG